MDQISSSRMDSSAITYTSFIAGSRCMVDSSRVIERENPGRTLEIAARWVSATPAQASEAMNAASAAFPIWAAVPLEDRIHLLTRLLEEIKEHTGQFAQIITRENGKPLRDSRSEVSSCLEDARYSIAEAVTRGTIELTLEPDAKVKGQLYLEPLGVCLLVTPWNFPLATIVRKLIPALLYGNAAVVKPSELTPGPACLLFQLIAALPFPVSTAQLVLGSGSEIGPLLTSHDALRAISFTGSNAVGAKLKMATTEHNVRLQLEMGGKNTLVVLADADLESAVEAAVIGGFTCSGQWCTGTGRVVVEQPLHDLFVQQLVDRLRVIRVGPGDDENSELGPVITAARVGFARESVSRTVAAGARAFSAGSVPGNGYYVAPTVLVQVNERMSVFLDELFVPVLPVIAAQDTEDAIRLANTGDFGLSASVFTGDLDNATMLARRIEAGMVHVNLHTAYRESTLPVSGWRNSGYGAPECGRFFRDFFTRPRAYYRPQ